jgi:hypothetical protein
MARVSSVGVNELFGSRRISLQAGRGAHRIESRDVDEVGIIESRYGTSLTLPVCTSADLGS